MQPTTSPPDPWLHRLALLVTLATFPLIFMGGLVTSKVAGMSVPDWPNSYGYNMVLFPPSKWVGGIWYEHVHRLLGTFVGFAAVALALYAWGPARTLAGRRAWGWLTVAFTGLTVASIGLVALKRISGSYSTEFFKDFQHVIVGLASLAAVAAVAWLCRGRETRRWVRWLTVAVLGAVVTQGVLGGLRVRAVNIDIAIIHACFAQAFLCLAAVTVVVTSRAWKDAKSYQPSHSQGTGWRLARTAALCVGLIYSQLVVGALMRHYKAGLAIPTLPLAFGKVLPPTDAAQLQAANAVRAFDYQLPGVSLTEMWLHFGHRVGALLVAGAVSWLVAAVWRSGEADRRVRWLTGTLAALVLTQFTLGVLTVYLLKPADLASAHVACGAFLLMTTAVLTVRLGRLYAPWFRTAAAPRPASFELAGRSRWVAT